MNKNTLPDFDEVTRIFESASLMVGAAEVHGVLAGLVCAGVKLDATSWEAPFNDLINEGLGLPAEAKKTATQLYSIICEQLTDGNMGFKLLLPDDEVPLDERAEAMAQWAQSFLVGFGIMQSKLNQAPENIQELITDIRDISQVSLDFEQEDEESELAFNEVVEYLRIGALLCFNEFAQPLTTTNDKPTLH
ncbi:UPF0149 family protein [Motilimonas cestriensis]|uniref:UPF0149 protein K6Y31_17110 n=1 Tax=Motilimonas cestriensis TaxID=2742685 RepID=A0ABS8WD80_9GAMM|nr:UPF0149 family protein [Motilimonas cestriensis]MCE2596518.1 UPF0149 family protein [Motilimonas cestriensis]